MRSRSSKCQPVLQLTIVIALGLACTLAQASDREKPLAEYRAAYTTGKIHVDGKINEEDWERAKTVQLRTRLKAEGRGVRMKTWAKVLWDESYLYVAFRCDDPDIWSPSDHRHDSPLFKGEVVEAYVDPDGDGKNYLEYELSPHGQTLDLKIPQPPPDDWESLARWDSAGLLTAVRINGTLQDRTDKDRLWTAEIAIPWKDFEGLGAKHLPPHSGDVWRLQLYRIERAASLGDAQFTAWSPTYDFHVPERFGRVKFVKRPKPYRR